MAAAYSPLALLLDLNVRSVEPFGEKMFLYRNSKATSGKGYVHLVAQSSENHTSYPAVSPKAKRGYDVGAIFSRIRPVIL